jgi:Flp pilus assembly protein TadD
VTSPSAAARADALIDLGRSGEAIAILSAALAGDPSSPELLRQLARAQLAGEDDHGALATAQRAVAADPESEWGYRILSLAFAGVGDLQNAELAAAEAQRLAPSIWQTHARRAIAGGQGGHFAAGMAAAHEAVRLAPNEADAHFAMGYTAMQAGRADIAEQAYLHTLALRPDHATAMNNLSIIQMKQRGGLTKAVQGLSAALSTDAQLAVARRNLDVVARRYMRRFHFGVVIAFIVLSIATDKPTTSNNLLQTTDQVTRSSRIEAGLLGVVAIVVLLGAIVAVHQRLPANLRPYYRRLPRADWTLGLWLAVDLAALIIVSCLAIPSTYSGRTDLVGIAWALVIAGLILSWVPRLRRRATPRHPSGR